MHTQIFIYLYIYVYIHIYIYIYICIYIYITNIPPYVFVGKAGRSAEEEAAQERDGPVSRPPVTGSYGLFIWVNHRVFMSLCIDVYMYDY